MYVCKSQELEKGPETSFTVMIHLVETLGLIMRNSYFCIQIQEYF